MSDVFSSIFGGAIPQACAPVQNYAAAQNQAYNANLLANMQDVAASCYPTRCLPAGILWTRTGGKTHRVVIRRMPETVLDLSCVLNAYGRIA